MDVRRPPRRLRVGPWRLAALAWLWLAPALAFAAQPWPPLLQQLHEAAIDNPEAALAEVQRRQRGPGAAGDAEAAFWLAVAAARLQIMLEADVDARASLREARRLFEARPQPDATMRAWLQFMELRHRAFTEGSVEALQALTKARGVVGVRPGTVLSCEWDETESWLLSEIGSYDEAWRVIEQLERCAAATGWPHYRAQALMDRAVIAGSAGAPGAARGSGAIDSARVAQLFDEAYAAVGPGEGRFLRSLIAYSAGTTLTELNRPADAARQLQRALEAGRALGDEAGVAAALTALALVEQREQRHAQALRLLAEAEPVLRRIGTATATRLITLYRHKLQSLVALQRRAELPAAVDAALALPEAGVQPALRSQLALAVAAAQAELGRHAAAYASMKRAHELAEQSRVQGSSAQVLRLQSLYDNSRREAEVASLRHAEESTRLSLQAQQATARMLWAALLAAVALAAGVGALGWRQWKRRHKMARLAMRDTLTGLHNRRAIEAYARSQCAQTLRLSLPFTVAMIDLDRFKTINDQYGHAKGDAVMRAFARAVPGQLRTPDRLGRWGGEEFLLVLPGTSLHELPALFMRLRGAFAAVAVPGMPQPHGCTFSMGGAEAGRDGSSFEVLLRVADRRLYKAKAAGRDRLR
ncbi:MAG: diguanylate cyclase [Betaproteobacteria bacterium]